MLSARGLHDLGQEAENNTVSNFLGLWRLKDATMSCAISRSKLQWLLSVSNGKTVCSAAQEHLLSYFLVGQRKCIGTNQYCGRREMTLVLITKREEINTLNVSFTASSFGDAQAVSMETGSECMVLQFAALLCQSQHRLELSGSLMRLPRPWWWGQPEMLLCRLQHMHAQRVKGGPSVLQPMQPHIHLFGEETIPTEWEIWILNGRNGSRSASLGKGQWSEARRCVS
ncbi:uncharacterized protein LOC119563838 isoform X2 [Chelonia mydas]|uniref:uncharacterized protein LOC119563838 isoform X2 n=1 Tax=Chelonia mydas TaxID=8469 RepID=UPI0018A244DF|nr:uncharacterized protein LOC119563838 isoform X2 [Chelonia mydas]